MPPGLDVREVDTAGLPIVCDHLDMTVWRTGDGRAIRCGERTQSIQDALAVLEAYDAAFRATGVTPRPFEVVRVGDRFGVVVEYVQGMTLGMQMTLGGYTPSEAGEALGEVALRVHRAHARCGLDMHAAYETMADRVSPLLGRPQARRLAELVRRIPASDTLLHGDLHPGNVVVYNGDLRLIDMDTVGFGHPAFDLACMESFVFRGVAEKVGQFGMTMEAGLEAAGVLWKAVLKRYFRGRDDGEIASIAVGLEILAGLTRCLGGPAYLSADNESTRAWMRENIGAFKSMLDEALPRVERLDFDVEEEQGASSFEAEEPQRGCCEWTVRESTT